MSEIYNNIRGYLKVSIKGFFLERFINICIKRNICLWDIERVGEEKVILKVSIKGFKNLRHAARKTHCKVSILQKNGIPFTLSRYKKRTAFMLGIIIFVVLTYYSTSFVWKVEVNSQGKIDEEELQNNLIYLGLEEGIKKNKIDTDKIENDMMIINDKIAWIGINIKGTKAIVEVKSRRTPPKIVDKEVPCNIVALKDGVIHKIIVRSGIQLVNAGDTVSKGDLLVSGLDDSKVLGVRLLHSDAEIIARTWYEVKKTVNLKKKVYERTGELTVKNRIKVFDYLIKLFINSGIPYDEYDTIISEKMLSIGDKYVLPLGLIKEYHYETREKIEEVPENDAIKNAVVEIKEDLFSGEDQKAYTIVSEEIEKNPIGNNKIEIILKIEALENIERYEIVLS